MVKFISTLALIAFIAFNSFGQCPNTSTTTFCTPTNGSTLVLGATTDACDMAPSEYHDITNLVAGNTYRFSFCNASANNPVVTNYNTLMTVYGPGGSLVASNDDHCGTNSQVQFTATASGTYRVLCNVSGNCGASSPLTFTPLTVTLVSAASSTATVTSINRASTNPTNASLVNYTVTFSASVSNLAAGNFSLTTTGTITGASVDTPTGSGTTWTVPVNTGSGDGTIRLDLANASGLTPSVTTPYTSGQVYDIDKTAPTIAITPPSSTSVGCGSVTYTVTYTGASSISLVNSNITLNTTGTANATIDVSGAGTSNRTVTLSNISGNGTLGISIAANTAMDALGNNSAATGSSTTFTVNSTSAPTGSAAQTFCAGAQVSNLNATGTALKWYDAASNGNLLSSTTALTNGTIYYASQTLNSCESGSRLAVTATVNSTSAPTGTAAQTFCAGAQVSNLSATGTALKWYDAASNGNLLSSTTALTNGTIYYASQTLNSCESGSRLAVTATVNSTSAPTGTAAQTFCAGAQVSNLNATGTALKWYDAASNGNLLSSTTALTNGTIYYASQTLNSCESSSRLAVTTTVNSTAAPTGNTAQTFCAGAQVSNLSATGTTLKWYDAASNGNLLSSTTALVNGTIYYASQTLNSCESSSRLAVTATVNSTAAPTGNAAQTFCAGAQVSNLSATGTALKWYDAASNGNLLSSTTALTNGTIYYASQTLNSCESSSRLAVTATVNSTSAPTGNAAQTFCAGAQVSNLSATGTALKWYDAASNGNLLSSTTALTNGTVYYASQTLNSCESSSRLAVTTTVNSTSAPTGNAAQTFCAGAQVSNLSATGTALKWYDAASNGNLLSSTTALTNGTIYYASQTLNSCESGSRLAVTATVNSTSVPTGTAAQTFCAGAQVSNLSATGTALKWYDAASNGNLLSSTTALTNGSVYYASQTLNSCESSSRLAVTATVNSTAAPTGNAAQTFCAGAQVSNLSATGTALKWYDAASNGNLLSSTTALTNGTIYYASQTLNSCESSSRLAVTATVNSTSAPTGSGAQTFCAGAQVSNLNATGTALKWYDAASNGNLLSSTTALTNGSVYYASQTLNSCESSSRLAVTATVNSTSAPTGNAAQTFCAGAQVSNLSATGTALKWYDAASNGNLLSNTTALTNGTTYYASQTLNSCESSTRLAVTATVNSTAAPTGNAAQTFCAGAQVSNLSATGTALKWYDAASNGNLLSSTTALTNGAVYYASQTLNSCESSSRLAVTATVNVVSVGGTASSPQTICAGTSPANLVLSGNVGVIVKWQKSNDASFSSPSDITSTNAILTSATISNLTVSTYFRAVVKSGVCAEAYSDAVLITVNPISEGGSILGSSTVCIESNNTPLTLVGQTGSVIKWQSADNSSFNNPTDIANTSNQLFTFNLKQNTYYRAVVKSGVCSETFSTTALVQIHTKPVVSLSAFQQNLLEGSSLILCDNDTNPNNALVFNTNTACLAGNLQWRIQNKNTGVWSSWSATAPSSQASDNQTYRYQAACDIACPSTYTEAIELTVNYQSAAPQNVSLTADGTVVIANESKTICDSDGNTLIFNATCASGETLLYSVDGSEYSTTVPVQMVDNAFHNYRVRCRKADGVPSCLETESAVMRLKISTIPARPSARITPTSNCGSPAAFSSITSCGALKTIWYNATTNVALPNLPSTTPTETTSFYARCENEAGCLSEKGNTLTFTVTPVSEAPVVNVSADLVCMGTEITVSANCPAGASILWNTGITGNSFNVSFNNVTHQTYSARCVFSNGCQSPVSAAKTVTWKGFELTIINIGQSQSATKTNDRSAWVSQFVTPDAGPILDWSTESSPTIFYTENVNKTGPRYWTIHADACSLGESGSMTFDMLATPETGIVRSYNTHENNAPYFMYANRSGYTELYAQNHPVYGFYLDNGSGGNIYDEGLPKGLYKLGVRYWDMKGWGSIYPSTRKPQGTVLAYQEYWFRIQSQNGIGTGAARKGAEGNVLGVADNGAFAQVMPNPVSNVLRLKVLDSKNQKVTVSLIDASGRKLLERGFVPETNAHQEEFEVSNLANGMYFLKVNAGDKQATLKVVKVQ